MIDCLYLRGLAPDPHKVKIMLNTIWSQIINDPTTVYLGMVYDYTHKQARIDFTNNNNLLQFLIAGEYFKDKSLKLDNSIYLDESKIISLTITAITQ